MLPTIILVCLVCLDWIGLRLGLSPSTSAIYEQCHSLWSVSSSKEKLFRTACVAIIVLLLAMWKYILNYIAELGDRSWKTHQMNLVYSAIVNGDENMLAFLKSQGAEYSGVSTFPDSNENFLFRAVKDKNAIAVKFIMSHEDLKPEKSKIRAMLDEQTKESKTLNQIIESMNRFFTHTIVNSLTEQRFLVACQDGNESEVHRHLENNVKLDLLDDDYNSPLHLAVKNEHENIIKLLLTKNPENNTCLLSQVDEDGCTAIEIAARTSLRIVKYIIAELGDRNWKTHQMNLVYSAIVNGDENMLAFLKSQGAEYSGESTFPGSNESFLFRAVKNKKAKAVRFIMSHEDLKPEKSKIRAMLDEQTKESKTLNEIIESMQQEET